MSWTKATAVALDVLRGAWMREIERFAEELRPRFERGELRGVRNVDPSHAASPLEQLEDLCCDRFAPDGISYEAICLALAASPNSEETDDDTWFDRRWHVAAAAAHDVLRIARERGWYTATPDEDPGEKRLHGP